MSFLGNVVGFQERGPDVTSARSELQAALVGDGVEFRNILDFDIPNDGRLVANANIDLTGDTITIAYDVVFPGGFPLSSGFTGYTFTLLDDAPAIIGASVVSEDPIFRLQRSDLLFTDDTLYVDTRDLTFDVASTVTIEVEFDDGQFLRTTSDDAQFVARLYTASFGRAPDIEGLNFWTDQFLILGGELPLSRQFLDSPEFEERFGDPGDLTADELVEQLYRNVLGRDGEQAGVDFWSGLIETGRIEQAEALEFFATSPENVQNTPELDFVVRSAASGDWLVLS